MSNLSAEREERMQDRKIDLHLLRVVKIVRVLLLQGGIQSILRTEVRYAA